MFVLVSTDGVKYELEPKVYRQSIFLRYLSESTNILEKEMQLSLPSDVFGKIVEFMEYHRGDPELAEDYDAFDVQIGDFDRGLLEMDRNSLFHLTTAANYLQIPLLLEMCCKTIAEALKEKTTDEIRKYLAVPPQDAKDYGMREYDWMG